MVFPGGKWTPLTNPDSGQVMIRSRFGAISSLPIDTPTGRTQNDDFGRFLTFGVLVGDFKGTYEPNMFGMHIGSVLSGLGIRNVNADLKMLSLPVFFGRKWVSLGGSKMRVFSMFGGLGGDFYKDT